MNLSPTQTHYLISAVTGALLAGVTAALTQYGNTGQADLRSLLVAGLGAAILFGRDWLRNNSGAFLEGTPPGQAATLLDKTTQQLAASQSLINQALASVQNASGSTVPVAPVVPPSGSAP